MSFKENWKYFVIGVMAIRIVGVVFAADTIITDTGITADTLDTGQGANELYSMNQDVETTDSVDFESSKITQTTTSGYGSWVYRNLASDSTDSALMFIEQDNAGDNRDALHIQQDGTGRGLYIDQNGNTVALRI